MYCRFNFSKNEIWNIWKSLKNIDLKDIVVKLKSGGIADKKLLIQFGVGFCAILIFLIGYYFFVSPILEKQEKKSWLNKIEVL